ncbi:hypothetical protein ACH5RR_039510 [Cinchona calisaya]|uniref:Uncharacterized protein n=1 Tax=Cinchona calisaya TaxID=153742 RepID=A0ABD2Y3J2_9GENT
MYDDTVDIEPDLKQQLKENRNERLRIRATPYFAPPIRSFKPVRAFRAGQPAWLDELFGVGTPIDYILESQWVYKEHKNGAFGKYGHVEEVEPTFSLCHDEKGLTDLNSNVISRTNETSKKNVERCHHGLILAKNGFTLPIQMQVTSDKQEQAENYAK